MQGSPDAKAGARTNYRYHAMCYLLMWLEKEQDYVRAISDRNMDESLRLKRVKQAAVHFSVARTLYRKGTGDSGVERYRPLLDALDRFAEEPGTSCSGQVESFERCVNIAYGFTTKRRMPSLVSKFLWLKFQAWYVLYDSQVRKALELKEGASLKDFHGAWRARFSEDQQEIKVACEDLATVLRFAPDRPDVSEANLRQTVAMPWFHERVLDMALWAEGAPK